MMTWNASNPMVVQGTWKMVVMGCINFEDQVLIKRRHANENGREVQEWKKMV
jgi:hypothetical protein